MTTCPDANDLSAYAVGGSPTTAVADIEAHLGDCADCRHAVLAAGRLPTGTPMPEVEMDLSAPGSLRRGLVLGRYVVVDLLGQGGMGSVYAAFDPELDRQVAIKVLKPAPGADAAEAQARLAREARTMARLAHPNVVAVYDVGTVGDELFVAMELVEGGTLREWLRAGQRPWREILRMFAAAGRGLAAAHEAGLVHRDFKPENILIGRDGRPRVGDFGLARPHELPLGPDTPAWNVQTAGLLGTPAYMSPEQLRMQPATPISDQFSFCTTLFEGLHGQRPYPGDTVSQLLANIEAGRLVDAQAHGVPAAVQRAVLRGLRPRPEDRHASMSDLLSALEVAPSHRWVGLAVVAVVMLGGATVALSLPSATGPSCDGAARVRDVWNPERRARVADMLMASGRPYARDVASSVQRSLDARTAAWAGMYREACEASQRGEQSAELLDRRMGCLATVRGQLAGTIEVLAAAPAEDALLTRAATAAAAIPEVAPCADRAALLAVVAPSASPAAHEHARRLRERLGEARARMLAYRLPEARGLAAALSVEATLVGSPDLEAEIRAVLAKVDLLRNRMDVAEAGFLRAAHLAARAHDDALMAESFVRLAEVHLLAGHGLEVKSVAALAEPLLTRSGDDPLRRARLLGTLAKADWGTNPEAALANARKSLELVRAAGAPALEMIDALDMISGADYFSGQLAAARAHVEEAMKLAEPLLGRSHPRMAGWLNNLGVIANLQGDEPARLDYYRRALALAEEGLGPEHLDVGEYSMNLGNAYAAVHRTREARPLLARGLELRRRHLGPDHAEVAQAVTNMAAIELLDHHAELARDLATQAIEIAEHATSRGELLGVALSKRGDALIALGAGAEAITDYERALAVLEKALGPDHLLTGETLVALGSAWLRSGQPGKAVPYLRRALALAEKEGSSNTVLDRSLVGLGEAALASGQGSEAISHAERALAIRERRAVDVIAIAEARWLTARALGSAGPSRARARKLAEDAATGYGEGTTEAAEIRAWLHRH